ncbi:TPA: hypothetical protein O7U53_004845 [Salmonella enterica]|nr:hypothetical protein [Salmonella enterica]
MKLSVGHIVRNDNLVWVTAVVGMAVHCTQLPSIPLFNKQLLQLQQAYFDAEQTCTVRVAGAEESWRGKALILAIGKQIPD